MKVYSPCLMIQKRERSILKGKGIFFFDVHSNRNKRKKVNFYLACLCMHLWYDHFMVTCVEINLESSTCVIHGGAIVAWWSWPPFYLATALFLAHGDV